MEGVRLRYMGAPCLETKGNGVLSALDSLPDPAAVLRNGTRSRGDRGLRGVCPPGTARRVIAIPPCSLP